MKKSQIIIFHKERSLSLLPSGVSQVTSGIVKVGGCVYQEVFKGKFQSKKS